MLSIIIVNYNVKYFTEQCLYSVHSAIAGMEAEVIVVDNNSPDESVGYLQKKFPGIRYLANKENVGYAKANNQGLALAKGDFILFLNPDTLLSEDCLQQSLAIFFQYPDAGALGIHMLDGSGRFLPESKRGFPSVAASFFKLSGLIRLSPRSKSIGAYYLGWLAEKQTSVVEVLSGAYMMVKKEVLEKTGGFDEQFFMYGEDIDLSYRIRQAGYKNYYLGESSIIHFKGESTAKDIGYTRIFYKAMDLFVQKHYGKKSRLFGWLMQAAIGTRGVMSFAGQLFSSRKKPAAGSLIDTLLIGEPQETMATAVILMQQPAVKRKITGFSSVARLAAAGAKADEIVFCAGSTAYKEIIAYTAQHKGQSSFKFSYTGSESIVGSDSKDRIGEVLILAEDRRDKMNLERV